MIRFFRNMYEYRELLRALAVSHVKARYKQTVLGVGWAVIPGIVLLLTVMVVFRHLFTYQEALPYSLYIFVGLWFWTFFSNALSFSVPVLVQNIALLKKIYFPREVLVVASTVPSLLDFCVNVIVFIFLCFYTHVAVSWSVLGIIPLFAILYMFTLGLALGLSMLNVAFRDVSKLLPLLLQMLLFVSPVVYGIAQIADKWRGVLKLNPLTGIIESVRTLLMHGSVDWVVVSAGMLVSFVVFIVGYYVFKKGEELASDIV